MKFLTAPVRCLALGTFMLGTALTAAAQTITPGPNSGLCEVTPTATGLTYTFAPASGSNQVLTNWSTKGDLQITSGTNSNTVTVQSTGFGRGQIIANYSIGACNPVPLPYEVNKKFSTNEPIIGPGCVKPGGIYTWSIKPIISKADQIAAQIGIDKYTWEITDLNGGTGPFQLPAQVSGSNDYSGDFSAIRLTMPTSFSAFKLRIKVGECNAFGPEISVYPTPNTPVITGPSCRPTSDLTSFTLSTPSEVGVTYIWNVPPTWTIAPASATSTGIIGTGAAISVSVTPDGNGGDVTVTATNGSPSQCGADPTAKYTLKRQLPATALLTGIPACFTVGTPYPIAVSPVANNSIFFWSVPAGYSGNGQAGPTVVRTSVPSITVTANISTTGRLAVSSDECGNPAVVPNQSGVISANLKASGDNGCTYGWTPIGCGALQLTSGVSTCLPVYNSTSNPGVFYTFSSPSNGTSPPQRSRTYTPDNGLTNELVTVKVENKGGTNCFEANFTIGPVTLTPCASRAGGGNTTKAPLLVYPNPTSGNLNIDLPLQAGETGKLILTDATGRQLVIATAKEARAKMDVSKVPQGVYTLRAELSSGKVLTQKVVVSHDAPATLR